jgi:uncharacterized protein YndB with AHSA1/START domain
MVKFTKNIFIAAPPEAIFDAIDDSANLPNYWRNISNVHNFKRIENGGTGFDFDYHMAGFNVKGSSIDLEHDRPRRIVTRTTGGLVSTLTFTFDPGPNGEGTNFEITAEYEMPPSLISHMAEAIVAKVNEGDINYVMNYMMLKFKK